MHVGYGAAFQNPNNALSDAEVWRNEVRLAEMAEPLGFDSVWSVEHHFDDYTMVPDVLQFLTYMAGRTKHAKLGSTVGGAAIPISRAATFGHGPLARSRGVLMRPQSHLSPCRLWPSSVSACW